MTSPTFTHSWQTIPAFSKKLGLRRWERNGPTAEGWAILHRFETQYLLSILREIKSLESSR
jgi:hypothetical protein